MTEKGGFRYKVSLSDTDNKDSFTHAYVTPFAISPNDLKNLYVALTDCRINQIMESQLGYNYGPVSLNLVTVSLKVSYEFGGLPYTTERLYFKYVKKSMATLEIFTAELGKICGSSVELFGFRVSHK